MKRTTTIAVATVLALALFVPVLANAAINPVLIPCRNGVAKASATFVKKSMKATQKCNEQNAVMANSCPPATLSAALAIVEQKMRDKIASKCASLPISAFGHGFLNYADVCPDSNPGDGFTLADLQDCEVNRHSAAVDAFIGVEYNNTADASTLKCQHGLGTNGTKLATSVLKAIGKCRLAVDKGQLAIDPETCPSEPITMAKINKAEGKAHGGIIGSCRDADVQALGICADPACVSLCGTCTNACAADCITQHHEKQVNDPSSPSVDLIDYEYTLPIVPATSCGDNAKNALDEECDGTDDAACPGLCGAPNSNFPCLCTDKPRQRVFEHADSDLDNGWTGISHDSGVVDNGSYLVDLYDCDGPGGPDTVCTLGPSCTGAPHSPCSTDAQCAVLSQGTCRHERTAVGPHCNLDPKKSCACTGSASNRSKGTCTDTTNCPGAGNFCIQQFHGPPLPITAGGIPVCILNIFTEDVTGTRDVAAGDTAFRLRQNSFVQVTASPAQPCPVCGGFCQAPAGGNRHGCSTNADCADVPPSVCVTANVCSGGPNVDDACRPDPPFGGPTALFGNPSVDCPPTINGAGVIDILFNPATTGCATLAPSVQCDNAGFSGKTCAGGSNNGAVCTTASECPGGACSFQCFCPNGGAVQQKPNGCDAACVGGAGDAEPCIDNTDCPGGFCHNADCRPDPTAPPALQPNEGGCSANVAGHCSINSYRECTTPADCAPPTCTECTGSQTCDFSPTNCFINSGINRCGVVDPTDPVTVAVFCIPPTNIGAVDGTSGLPGPGTLRQPLTIVDTGL